MTVPETPPLVSVVIPNHNGAAHLETCLQSLARQGSARMEVILVDNASTDRSLEVVRSLTPAAILLRQETNLGFAAAVNAGARAARGDWIAVLNNDTEVQPGWIEAFIAAVERHPEASFFACRILDLRERDRIFSVGDCFLRGGIGYRRGQRQADRADYRRECAVFSASGCAALYRKQVFDALGGYDEDFFAYLEDVDLGLRMQAAGHVGFYVPDARVCHLGGGTSGGEFSPLAVRLRTRNSILMLVRSMPARILWRSAPMILAAQASWLSRAVARGRLWSYVRGLAAVLPLLPAMLRKRRSMRGLPGESVRRLWNAILESEEVAREDFEARSGPWDSRFLEWYFRVFKASASPALRR